MEERPGIMVIEIPDQKELLQEAGGHRIQRIPPTERNGRVHTSTVTVAVINDYQEKLEVSDNDLLVEWFSGTGAGGQHRNKTMNTCRMTHKPSGIRVVCGNRDRKSSYRGAKEELLKRLKRERESSHTQNISQVRLKQVGSGMRGDKIRSYRFQDGLVHDHRTNKSAKIREIMKGNFELLWH